MNLGFDTDITSKYSNNSQKIRVMTENWVLQNMFCPICGNLYLQKIKNNKPVADFYCDRCGEQYELKSKKNKLGKIINDGAYNTMIERISDNCNPNFLFLTYNNTAVNDFMFIPNHFFTPSIIIKRKPLSDSARRAGWIGCNINLEPIPNSGKIYIIRDGIEINKNAITEQYNKTKALLTTNIENRSWLLDVLTCVDKIKTTGFCLSDVYQFENVLKEKHPNNNFIKDKIRQQLQLLRDKGYIEFSSRGNYKKLL